MKRKFKVGMVVAIKRTGRYYSKDGVGNYMRVRAIERFQTQDGKYTIVNGAWREEEIRPLTEREKG